LELPGFQAEKIGDLDAVAQHVLPGLHDWVINPPVAPEERDRSAPRIVCASWT
jgi:hypothetical protein